MWKISLVLTVIIYGIGRIMTVTIYMVTDIIDEVLTATIYGH